MKICIHCKIPKTISEYYTHSKMSDGRINKCKDCVKAEVNARYALMKIDPNFIERERKRGRDKYRRLYTGKGKGNTQTARRHLEKYPEKEMAKNLSAHLEKPFIGAERHHWSYNHEHVKDVVWLPKKSHMKAHRFIVYDSQFKMYRRCDTNELLDSRMKHCEFIFSMIQNEED